MILYHRKSSFLRSLIPAFIAYLLVFLGGINFQLHAIHMIMPLFAVITVFYWQVYKPEYLQKITVFFLGIFQDILYSTVLGSSSLLLLLLVFGIRKYSGNLPNQPFWFCWVVFAAVCSVYVFCQWGLYSFLFKQIITNPAILYQLGITILLYPLFHKIFSNLSVKVE